MKLIPYFSHSSQAPLRNRWREGEPDVNELLSAFWDVDDASAWVPRLDVHENKDAISIFADLPGLDKKNIQISVEDGVLILRGERKSEREEKAEDGTWHRVERSSGNFQRSINLGESVDADKVNAEYKDGVLRITLPKKEASKPKVVSIS